MVGKIFSYNQTLVVVLPLALLCAIFLFAIPNSNYQFNFLSTCRPPALSSPPLDSNPEFKLLIGILTLPEKYERRQIIRMAYELQKPTTQNVQIDIRFVFCNLSTDEQKVFIAMEIVTYRDIIILNCTENMNKGKTYTYFSSLPRMFPGKQRRPYDYVIKADDDTYFRLDNLVASLRDKPREDVYWGKGFEPMITDPKNPPYLVGMGYALSWDLVEWISTSEFAQNHSEGIEDIFVGMWLNVEGKGKNRYDMREKMYDFHGVEPKDFPPETIAVHMLKNEFTWAVTLRRFNVTDRIEPSRFYHI